MDSDEVVIVGSIGSPYGVRGWVRVNSFTQPPDNLAEYGPWLLRVDGAWRERHPLQVKRHGAGLVARFASVSDREQAAGLSGTEVAVRRDALPGTEVDEYYWRDLEGLEVIDQHGERLGRIERLMDIGVHAVVVVAGMHGECLIPFVARHIRRVDVAAGRVEVDWDEPQ